MPRKKAAETDVAPVNEENAKVEKPKQTRAPRKPREKKCEQTQAEKIKTNPRANGEAKKPQKSVLDTAKESFPFFLTIVWQAIGLPKPTPVQVDFAMTLQHPPSKSMVFEAFRGMGKSFILCAYSVWRLWLNADDKIMIVSASKERADANALFIKKIISVIPFLAHLLPEQGQRDTRTVFDVGGCKPDSSPSVKSVGITGQLTGSRADIIIADDVESFNNSYTLGQRERLFEAVKEFDAVLKPGGRVFFLGTPQTENTLYNEVANRGYVIRIWPARYPLDEKQRQHYIHAEYGDRLAPTIANKFDEDPDGMAGKPVDSLRFDDEELWRKETSYGKIGFLLQFMLDTSLSDEDKYELKLKDFIVAELNKEAAPMTMQWLPNDRTKVHDLPVVGLKGDAWYSYYSCAENLQPYALRVMTIDPSGKGKDETAYSVGYFLNGYIFLMEAGGFQSGYSEETLHSLARIAKEHKIQNIIVEGNYGSGMWSQLFKPILYKYVKCSVEDINSKGQKELRILDTIGPVLTSHKIVVNKDVIQQDFNTAVSTGDRARSLFYQLTRITRERQCLVHDDRLDAFSMLIDCFNDLLSIDSNIGEQQLTEQWLEDSIDNILGLTTHEFNGMLYTEVDEFAPYWRNAFKNASSIKEEYLKQNKR